MCLPLRLCYAGPTPCQDLYCHSQLGAANISSAGTACTTDAAARSCSSKTSAHLIHSNRHTPAKQEEGKAGRCCRRPQHTSHAGCAGIPSGTLSAAAAPAAFGIHSSACAAAPGHQHGNLLTHAPASCRFYSTGDHRHTAHTAHGCRQQPCWPLLQHTCRHRPMCTLTGRSSNSRSSSPCKCSSRAAGVTIRCCA